MSLQEPPTPPLLEELRRRTETCRRQLDSSPFLRAFAAGELALESYVGWLRATAVIRAPLERQLERTLPPALGGPWVERLKRFSYLEQDLAFFSENNILDIPEAMDSALGIAEKLRLRSERSAVSLLGYLYVFEESMKEAPLIRVFAARSFHLDGEEGLRYLASAENTSAATWDEFGEWLNGALVAPDAREAILEAACELFAGWTGIVAALHPFQKEDLKPLAVSLNPEAGRHLIPADPRELEAARRAGEICWQRFPYLTMRYGDRGRRFTSSDGAWLVTLTDFDQTTANQQILWLGRVLAVRGIPRLILEVQLQLLYAELCNAVPAKEAVYAKLLQASRMLHAARTARIDESRFESLAVEFDAKAGGEAAPLLGAGRLVLSAVMDEEEGISGAAASLIEGLKDPSRFSPAWTETLDDFLREAWTIARHKII